MVGSIFVPLILEFDESVSIFVHLQLNSTYDISDIIHKHVFSH